MRAVPIGAPPSAYDLTVTTLTEQLVDSGALRLTFRDVDPARDPLPAMSEADFDVNDLRLGTCVGILETVNTFCVTVDLAAVFAMKEANADVRWLRRARWHEPGTRDTGDVNFEDYQRWQADVEPTVRGMTMHSPLVLDIVTRVTGAGGLAATAAYLFKHPEQIGSWLPRVRASWYDARTEAEKARRAHERLMLAGMQVEEPDE